MERLRIVHCFRSPVGGIFRHVRDLVEEQAGAGDSVGIICDSSTGGAFEDGMFEEMRPQLALGLERLPMTRAIGPSDIGALRRITTVLRDWRPDVLHSHGAKGGAYARLAGARLRRSNPRLARLYCPHGGSVHYEAGSRAGRIYFAVERALERLTDRLIFVSAYERDAYRAKVGEPRCPHDLVLNGLAPEEFEPVATRPDAADFLYIGMMRDLKGADLFLRAVASLSGATAHAVGDGPDLDRYRRLVRELDAEDRITFHAPMPAREAFALADTVVVPSRAESMPYIVLEALAAGKRMIATRVGGIPEIFADYVESLVAPDNLEALIAALRAEQNGARTGPSPQEMRHVIKHRFSRETMARTVMEAYRRALSGG